MRGNAQSATRVDESNETSANDQTQNICMQMPHSVETNIMVLVLEFKKSLRKCKLLQRLEPLTEN